MLSASPPDSQDLLNAPKPGRKPILSEPKNKRTAQNRAAQRAFRERKEKRMKELELKVELLENEKSQISNESELLRMQVETLMEELNKVKGNHGNNTDNPPLSLDALKKLTSSNTFGTTTSSAASANRKNHDSSISSRSSNAYSPSDSSTFDKYTPVSSSSTPNSTNYSSNSSANINSNKLNGNTTTNILPPVNNNQPSVLNSRKFQFPWSNSNDFSLDADGEIPFEFLVKSSSLNSSNPNANEDSNNNTNSQQVPELSSCESNKSWSSKSSPTNLVMTANDNFTGEFDETVNSFCAELGNVCGTKANPIPKDYNNTNVVTDPTTISSVDDFNSPFQVLIDNTNQQQQQQQNQQQQQQNVAQKSKNSTKFIDNSDFLLNSNFLNQPFDASLVFNNNNSLAQTPSSNLYDINYDFDTFAPEEDEANDLILNGLVTEDSKFDPLNSDPINYGNVHVNVPGESEEDDVVVPNNSQNLMKCSQIWERITAHPRFSEIDIDGLCNELKSKAKCSENGVVVGARDVNDTLSKVIENSIKIEEQPQQQVPQSTNKFLAGL
ncbi:hypothetical protein BVG19_g862 [[Candida] boidinii]|nr:hypothetical protein BVG19_g862 [[Candida] boidinii]OWB48741.1 hypothetical protein B5S27_g276 [[Candida] boidinii]